jgi:hypothetical protein
MSLRKMYSSKKLSKHRRFRGRQLPKMTRIRQLSNRRKMSKKRR